MESDSSAEEGPAMPPCDASRVTKPVADGALQCSDSLMKEVGDIVHDG